MQVFLKRQQHNRTLRIVAPDVEVVNYRSHQSHKPSQTLDMPGANGALAPPACGTSSAWSRRPSPPFQLPAGHRRCQTRSSPVNSMQVQSRSKHSEHITKRTCEAFLPPLQFQILCKPRQVLKYPHITGGSCWVLKACHITLRVCMHELQKSNLLGDRTSASGRERSEPTEPSVLVLSYALCLLTSHASEPCSQRKTKKSRGRVVAVVAMRLPAPSRLRPKQDPNRFPLPTPNISQRLW